MPAANNHRRNRAHLRGGSEGNSSGGVAEAEDGGLGGDPGRTVKLLRWIAGAGVQRGGGFTAAHRPARRGRAERCGGGTRVAVAAAGWRGETQGGVGVRLKEVAEDLGMRARKGNQRGSRAEIAAWPLRKRGEDEDDRWAWCVSGTQRSGERAASGEQAPTSGSALSMAERTRVAGAAC